LAVSTRLQSQPFDAAVEHAAFLRGRMDDGAVATFTGLARRAGAGGPVERLVLDHYPGMTEASIEAIARDGAARFEVSDLLVVHRYGEILPGEAIVFVAAASRSRADALACADYLMDRLKTEAAFWKREEGGGASRWIEPTDMDRERRARWSE
jgi:molybdopterin synthase catalytic subunit